MLQTAFLKLEVSLSCYPFVCVWASGLITLHEVEWQTDIKIKEQVMAEFH